MGSYIPPLAFNGGNSISTQLVLAGTYESRQHTLSQFSVPRAQFAANTEFTLTDGSYNTRSASNTSIDTPPSATAFLASSVSTNGTGGKPLVIKLKRDELTSEIKQFGVFNADGSHPGSTFSVALSAAEALNQTTLSVFDSTNVNINDIMRTSGATFRVTGVGAGTITVTRLEPPIGGAPPLNADGLISVLPIGSIMSIESKNQTYINSLDPFGTNSRYRVNPLNAEIYVNNAFGMVEISTLGSTIDFQDATYQNQIQQAIGQGMALANKSILEGLDKVVGFVQFDTLQGSALYLNNNRANDLSTSIQSLTSVLRSTKDAMRGTMNTIR